ncbi:DUF4202 domain-containing protein [Aureibaculum algae]|uniref:DUF4202 domain-containing protein n=1 Tax=Aureibaculum algae TaxID=2584122 RepID=A0A5B7TZ23_9FLAO|nr:MULTISPECIES: DUF4202 domain-containing protein [Aureibaculum]QCX40571.1 DUF4202 domain-containing protein [Aureibaculum algae]
MNTKYENAIALFDKANSDDPNKEIWNGTTYPKELLYAQRMTEKLDLFEPNASYALKLAVRCQHICRWQIPRDSYEMNRKGYLTWRSDLSVFHAKTASEILKTVGFDEEFINSVTFLLKKKQLKKNKDTQILEDVICLVFLDYYFETFSGKYSEEKLIDILKKTWAKMSEKGHDEAMKINFSKNSIQLIQKALA